MDPLTVLFWILAGIGGLVLLTAVAFFALFMGLMIFGFRLMRDDEAAQLPERTDR
ncbi:hypothetical protein AB0E56_13165 [Microbacterium sp. NPDC028030]|uniref:hypothetical protein n=1 Tax=Microbacterium sp. NPDC028030 TaxID=3155124 RepID=UPI00340FF112